jgi:hypothetical protein
VVKLDVSGGKAAERWLEESGERRLAETDVK